ncbi:hypothetical protein E2C01_038673 [Portunus trituberculatus]|uniref:Uncharacterized protein n=1 Tax=Portunus trituberculatus TaxID=210409 RepID=A0A5B7FBF2_PORTR|nr:hypothetical protein [Portunus trituberculatus]
MIVTRNSLRCSIVDSQGQGNLWAKGDTFLWYLLSQSPPAKNPFPRVSGEAQPTLGPWTGFEPVRLETPRTPKHA